MPASQYSQKDRRLEIETPLGPDALLLTGFTGKEEMSRLFHYRLDLLSEKDSIAPKDIVGKNVTFWIRHPDGTPRHFNGHVSKFACSGKNDRLSIYTAEVVPWLWFLTRTRDCRIFQTKSVPDIIEQVFKEMGFTAFETSEIKGTHVKWDYCVQYRETDFDFISRLAEHEGIFYWFRHEKGKHTMVLGDQKRAYKDLPEKEVSFAASLSAPDPTDLITSWEHAYEFRPGKWAQTDYNFETPSASLLTKTKTVLQIDELDKFEIFEFPGEYEKKGDGESDIKLRMEEEEAAHDVVMGSGKCRSFNPGGRFTVKRHHLKAEEGKAYAVIAVEHQARLAGSYTTGGGAEGIDYTNTFRCIPDSVTFRPARITQKPFVHGPQTAVIVGPPGETIYTDKFGRVKVQFFWDREGKKDDKSSCWIRVSQPWGGGNWGGMFIPHVGQEVIVAFLEGDPDRPIVVGRVYNAEQMPPVALPAGKSQSAIRDHGGNEIIMEGEAGKQQMRLFSPTHNTCLTLGKGSGDLTTDTHVKVTTGQDYIAKIGGNIKSNVQGNVWDAFIGNFVRFIGGFISTVIVGAKIEVIRGAEIKNIKGVKSEMIKGHVFKGHNGRTFELKKSSHLEKSPSLMEQVKQASAMYEHYKLTCKGNKHFKTSGDLKEKAAKIENTADDIGVKVKGGYKLKSDVLKEEAATHSAKYKDSLLKAGKWLCKAKSDFNDGTLKIS